MNEAPKLNQAQVDLAVEGQMALGALIIDSFLRSMLVNAGQCSPILRGAAHPSASKQMTKYQLLTTDCECSFC